MIFFEDMDKLLYDIKQDIKAIEKYIKQLENDNVYWDTWTVEDIIRELETNINELYVLTNPDY